MLKAPYYKMSQSKPPTFVGLMYSYNYVNTQVFTKRIYNIIYIIILEALSQLNIYNKSKTNYTIQIKRSLFCKFPEDIQNTESLFISIHIPSHPPLQLLLLVPVFTNKHNSPTQHTTPHRAHPQPTAA